MTAQSDCTSPMNGIKAEDSRKTNEIRHRLWPRGYNLETHVRCFFVTKTNQMHQLHKFILSWNSTCFGQFVCPSSVYSLHTQQWYT